MLLNLFIIYNNILLEQNNYSEFNCIESFGV